MERRQLVSCKTMVVSSHGSKQSSLEGEDGECQDTRSDCVILTQLPEEHSLSPSSICVVEQQRKDGAETIRYVFVFVFSIYFTCILY